jgi:AraC-like DNA-binding protein
MHSLASASARLAKQVVTLLRWQPDDFVTDRGDDCKAEEKTISGLLWGSDWGSGNRSIEHLQTHMRAGAYPRVRARLPQDFCELNTARASATLRRHIDPGEWVPSYWLSRVGAAEIWLEAAESLSPGRMHMKPSETNQKRVGVARSLIQQGLPKKEIALRLGISPSHLSHLLRRMK